MKVTKTYPTTEAGHVIETGQATWDSDEISVRNRYPTSNGGFSPRSSSELPIRDLRGIIEVVAHMRSTASRGGTPTPRPTET